MGCPAAGTKNLKDHRNLLLERRAIIARHSVQPASAADTDCSLSCYHSGPGKGKKKRQEKRRSILQNSDDQSQSLAFRTLDLRLQTSNGKCSAGSILSCLPGAMIASARRSISGGWRSIRKRQLGSSLARLDRETFSFQIPYCTAEVRALIARTARSGSCRGVGPRHCGCRV
jgi:hypothetical protein